MCVGKPTMDEINWSFTRPANTTAYAAGDLVADNTTAGSVIPMQFEVVIGNGRGIKIVGARLEKSDETDVANATFTLHLYKASPVVANGDNGALSTDVADKIGEINFPIMTAYTDAGLAIINAGAVSGGFNALNAYLRATDIMYGLLEAEAAYSPASEEIFTTTLLIEQY